MSMTTTIAAVAGAYTPAESASGGGAPHEEVLGVHRGAIDQTTITTRPPYAVMKQVDGILHAMGVETQKEGTFKYRCVRPQKGAAAALSATHAGRVGSPDYNTDSASVDFDRPAAECCAHAKPGVLYGSPADDSMGEVRFSVELTQLLGLKGTYSLDIRRLKGNLKSYSFIYNTIRERAELNL